MTSKEKARFKGMNRLEESAGQPRVPGECQDTGDGRRGSRTDVTPLTGQDP